MNTLKGIAAVVCFCAIAAGMFLFLMLGVLCLSLRDGILWMTPLVSEVGGNAMATEVMA